MPQREQTAEWAKGRWPHILAEMGVDRDKLTGKHGPCPICGGEDRFRFDDKESRGTYFCSGCGAGDGFDLLMKYMGWDFQAAANAVDELRGRDVPRETFKEPMNYERRRSQLNKLWADARAPFVWQGYLQNQRGLNKETIANICTDVRGVTELLLTEDGEKQGYHPAMVSLIRDLAGNPISIHRTYLIGTNPMAKRKKKLMPGMATISGCAAHLIEGSSSLVVGEGIETTLAGWEHLVHNVGLPYDLGAWAAISANGLKELFLPETLTTLWICADNDHSFTGQAAAFELARRVKSTGRTVKVLMPHRIGCDVMDCYKQDEVEII